MHNIVTLDASTAAALQQHADRLGELARDTAVGLWEMGKILADAQDRLAAYGTGSFQQWIEGQTALSTKTAYRLINVFKAFDCVNLTQTTFATSALYLLSEPSTPPAARAQAIQEAAQGTPITPARAQEIVQSYQPPPKPPEYRAFERERLMPRLHDAGMADAPQILTGLQDEIPKATEEQREQAKQGLREMIVEQLVACRDGLDVEQSADEILELLGQFGSSIAIAARFGAALAGGPKTLADLTALAIETCGGCAEGMERDEYLRWRKRALRLIDSLSYVNYEGGCLLLYEHRLSNGQMAYGLLPPNT